MCTNTVNPQSLINIARSGVIFALRISLLHACFGTLSVDGATSQQANQAGLKRMSLVTLATECGFVSCTDLRKRRKHIML